MLLQGILKQIFLVSYLILFFPYTISFYKTNKTGKDQDSATSEEQITIELEKLMQTYVQIKFADRTLSRLIYLWESFIDKYDLFMDKHND